MFKRFVAGFLTAVIFLNLFLPSLTYAQENAYPLSQESTYLTFPEWYIVFSAQEYADFLEYHLPSAFPYRAAIWQYWSSYGKVISFTSAKYGFNIGDHIMLIVIGLSLTAEYHIKDRYESTFGLISELSSGFQPVEEDLYAAQVAKEYGQFLPHTPWYDFPFGQKLVGLWEHTSFFGPHMYRKWERKMIYSAEYLAKAAYGWIIRSATESTYAPAAETIPVTVQHFPDFLLEQDPRIKLIRIIDPATKLISLPRYDQFNDIVPKLAKEQVRFVDMAGNQEIMITILTPRAWQNTSLIGTQLFEMNILTNINQKRVALNIPIGHLSEVINLLQSEDLTIEHIYDY